MKFSKMVKEIRKFEEDHPTAYMLFASLVIALIFVVALLFILCTPASDGEVKTNMVMQMTEQKTTETKPATAPIIMKKDFDEWSIIVIKDNNKVSYWVVSKDAAHKYHVGGEWKTGQWEEVSKEESVRLLELISENYDIMNIIEDIENERAKMLYFEGFDGIKTMPSNGKQS